MCVLRIKKLCGLVSYWGTACGESPLITSSYSRALSVSYMKQFPKTLFVAFHMSNYLGVICL